MRTEIIILLPFHLLVQGLFYNTSVGIEIPLHPLYKQGPKRKKTVTVRKLPAFNSEQKQTTQLHVPHSQLSLQNSHESESEVTERKEIHAKLFAYIVQKYTAQHSPENTNGILNDVRQFLEQSITHEQKPSLIHYMELVDENPDCDETMAQIGEDLLERFSTGAQQGWVVLVVDGKTYEHLMNVKRQYSHTLKKLLILPGDWHTLKNFQPVLMKVYFHAGPKELAKASGYRGSTLSSLENNSNFKRTHNFLLQVWEALYREMFQAYCTTSVSTNISDVLAAARCILSTSISENHPPQQVMKKIRDLIEDTSVHTNFLQFLEQQSKSDDTWKFWVQFVMQDCYAYIGLYLAIRGSNWRLRMSSLKQMAPLFSAFDRDTYQKVIPNHLADIQQYPPEILNCLQKGGFTVSITGKEWHPVALDEAHEMCIKQGHEKNCGSSNTGLSAENHSFL